MNKSKTKDISNREVKSSAFTVYFSDPENAAQLYSALSGEPVAPDDIEFRTLEDVLFVARKNDLSFTVRNRILIISEHQSTLNLNMPLRSAIYFGRTIEKLIDPKALYRRKRILIPTPEFYVFYNGDEPCPPEEILKLSSTYLEKTSTPMLELNVKVININLPEGHIILEQCRPLYEYSWFIQKIKEYITAGMIRDDAITLAIKDCERDGVMTEFVRAHGSEAVNMLFTQFNMDDALEANYEEGYEDGVLVGTKRGEIQKIIQQVSTKLSKGKTPEVIADELEEDVALISKICIAIQEHGNMADIEKIYEKIRC